MNANVKSHASRPVYTSYVCKLFNLLLNPYSLFKITPWKIMNLCGPIVRRQCTGCIVRGEWCIHVYKKVNGWLALFAHSLHNLCLYYDCGRCLMLVTTPCLYLIVDKPTGSESSAAMQLFHNFLSWKQRPCGNLGSETWLSADNRSTRQPLPNETSTYFQNNTNNITHTCFKIKFKIYIRTRAWSPGHQLISSYWKIVYFRKSWTFDVVL